MILICFGTRPEWLKIKPLLEVLKNFKIFFTGQHEDLLVNELNQYSDKIIRAQIHSNSNNRLNNISSSIFNSFPEDKFEAILVQGDTASAFACAISGFNSGIKVVYLESGLRSFDLKHPYPEEGYRQMISRISDINLCPTELSLKNLESENNVGVNYIVGNTVLDNIKNLKTKANYENIVLITLHRRENLPIINQWLEQIKKVAKSYPEKDFVIIEHPNKTLDIGKTKNLIKIRPKNHNDFLNLLIKCKLIITDSGGLQEEGSFLNKKIIVCRKVTERPEGIDTGHIYLSKTPDDLFNLFKSLINNYSIDSECPYGDGNSSHKILKIFKENDISA
jgi:UDP-N-acetylglucosamine 2-epimerase (non-hydrolysing)